MDILLITPDHDNKKNNYPWSALSVGSYLSNVKGYEVALLDGSVYTKRELLKEIESYCRTVKLIGISCMSSDTHYVKGIVDHIKNVDENCKIIVGGSHARLQPEQTCLYKNIDFVSYTDGEHTVSMLYDEIKSGNHRYDKVPGLIYKKGQSVIRTAEPKPINFYDINYDLLPESTRKTFHEYIQVLTGRGCNFKCSFCFNSVCRQSWRGRPMPEIINEIGNILVKYNPNVIYFRDENFFLSKKRIEEFISAYKEKNFSFKWRATCFAGYYNKQYIDFEFLKKLEGINCETMKFGLESGSQRVLNSLNKMLKVENVKRLVKDLAKVKGIQANYSFIIGLPTETFEEQKETLALIKYIIDHEPDAFIIGPQYFRIYAGGKLYDEIKSNYNYTEPRSFEEWALKYNPEEDWSKFGKHVSYPWTVHEHEFFAQHADVLVNLSRQPITINLKFLLMLPFILMATLRMKYEWYTHLYDLKIYVSLLRFALKTGLKDMIKRYSGSKT